MHRFAFRPSARLVGADSIGGHEARIAAAQLGGAAVTGLLAALPVLALPPPRSWTSCA